MSEGGHLDIHTDFNFHSAMGLERRINVLIYLNKDWREEYGGCFEIWDQKMSRCCRRVVPAFNTCVIFNTSLTSFHGNPVPVNHPERKPRRAIALYYYTATWDKTHHARTTQFKVRPASSDEFDWRVRVQRSRRRRDAAYRAPGTEEVGTSCSSYSALTDCMIPVLDRARPHRHGCR